MDSLLSDIDKLIVDMWGNEADIAIARDRIKTYFVNGFNDITNGKFPSKLKLIGLGGANVVLRINSKIYRIAYYQPKAEWEADLMEEFDLLNAHDFGILPPLSITFKADEFLYHEIEEAYPYQGASLKEFSILLHKVLKLAKYDRFWADFHLGNIMVDKKGKLIITDFDTSRVNEWVSDGINKYKDITLPEIMKYIDKFLEDWRVRRELRYKIFSYLKIPITNESWMKFIFGEMMFKYKYHISEAYPSSLLNSQMKYHGAIPF